MIVADASVILKWVLSDEGDRKEAFLLRERHLSGEDPIAAPELIFYEIANVLPMRWPDEHKVGELFQEICREEIKRIPFGISQFVHSIHLARRYDISGYDAAYVALAEQLRCRFVTADERLLHRLKGAGHAVHLREIGR